VNLVLDWAEKYVGGDFKVVQANGIDCADNDLPQNASELVQKIITFAMAQRGKPYVFGANGPDAWDCSSLIQAAYRSAGLAIPRTTFEQWPYGVKVGKGKELPGDLVFFNSGPGTSSNSPGHVGMVIGNGKMIVASCSSCVPAIGVKTYKRPDWVGVTRPLARPDMQKKVDALAG
jgi:cell wall-associated NlpC family hydrolase